MDFFSLYQWLNDWIKLKCISFIQCSFFSFFSDLLTVSFSRETRSLPMIHIFTFYNFTLSPSSLHFIAFSNLFIHRKEVLVFFYNFIFFFLHKNEMFYSLWMISFDIYFWTKMFITTILLNSKWAHKAKAISTKFFLIQIFISSVKVITNSKEISISIYHKNRLTLSKASFS